MIPFPDFSDYFRLLWGYAPFPWQRTLAARLVDGEIPRVLDLPTAAGKTACIDIALYALAAQAEKPVWERTAPRRIWFVVDRRIVVDEAYDRAWRIASRLHEAKDGPLKAVADRLFTISGVDPDRGRPLATARLRGGTLRDDGWARLPSQPAVITSTVDQLGSRLLFRGYGHSPRTAPIFAGLAAHDSLILLDEAHLSVPFLETLRAVQRYRGAEWAEEPIRTPFAFTMLSATPPSDIPAAETFPGADRASALDHPELKRRIAASKSAELVEIKPKRSIETDALVDEAVFRARDLAGEQGHQRVGVVVNRVATAQAVEHGLRTALGERADVVLLTGRLRPLERDRLVARWGPVLRAGSEQAPERPVVLVATQCIEVGADFSFDAMVTEAASLDALRQRFGRLNRLGATEVAAAAILIRAEQAKQGHEDPVYGTAMSACWGLLNELAESQGEGKQARNVIDLGIDAFDASLEPVDDISPYLAPTTKAPMLLPAHLDLLCQTGPAPAVQPDVSLYLHGTDRGPPEVRVVWRADLDLRDEGASVDTVALCPPSSVEALSVPLYRLRQFLTQAETLGESADVEGASWSEEAAETPGGRGFRPAIVWRGRERSQVIRNASEVRPGDLVVLPAEYGMAGLGQSSPEVAFGGDRLDIWEPSHAEAGKGSVLRLQRRVLAPWRNCTPVADLIDLAHEWDGDREALQAAIDAVMDYAPEAEDDPPAPPEWLTKLLEQTRQAQKIERHPMGGVVLFAPRKFDRQSEEPDLFADDDDLLSAVGEEVPLARHSATVERAVDQLAGRCLPEGFREPLKAAAYWHDAGKLDERFQLWLREGNELDVYVGTPIAKSKAIATSPTRRRWLREASKLPDRFRHEMLSLQLAERCGPVSQDGASDDLVLHAIASHHGHGRPFAPVVPDPDPPAVRGEHDGVLIDVDAETRAAWAAPHGLASGTAERFWRLTRRYGWWGLAYLEAILRLGDWYGSQWTVEAQPDDAGTRTVRPTRAAVEATADKPLVLTGLDGSNPLAFLASLGTLSLLREEGFQSARIHWVRDLAWIPIISGVRGVGEEEASKVIERQLSLEGREELKIGIADEPGKRVIDCDAEHYRYVASSSLETSWTGSRLTLDFLAAFASDAVIDKDKKGKPYENKNKKPKLMGTLFQFARGSGQQYFLGSVDELMSRVSADRIREALFERWSYKDEKYSMRWDPTEDRRYALMDRDPTANDNKPRTMWMANLLAYRALAMFPAAPQRKGLAITGWSEHGDEESFTWPLWTYPADPDTVRSLLLLPELYDMTPDRSALRARGVEAAYRARRIKVGAGAQYKINFSPAREV